MKGAYNSGYSTFQLPVPTRFIFVLLLPIEHRELEGHIIGRSMGTLMVDDVTAILLPL